MMMRSAMALCFLLACADTNSDSAAADVYALVGDVPMTFDDIRLHCELSGERDSAACVNAATDDALVLSGRDVRSLPNAHLLTQVHAQRLIAQFESEQPSQAEMQAAESAEPERRQRWWRTRHIVTARPADGLACDRDAPAWKTYLMSGAETLDGFAPTLMPEANPKLFEKVTIRGDVTQRVPSTYRDALGDALGLVSAPINSPAGCYFIEVLEVHPAAARDPHERQTAVLKSARAAHVRKRLAEVFAKEDIAVEIDARAFALVESLTMERLQ